MQQIIHSPESPMPPPYDVYVQQRAEGIASVLEDIVDDNVQLCPRAIYPDEKVFSKPEAMAAAITYGCVVENEQQGYKTALYEAPDNPGVVAYSPDAVTQYIEEQAMVGNERIRMKDPSESDGHGQLTTSSMDEALEFWHSLPRSSEIGMVLMPHIDNITDRFMVCQINLGKVGVFSYLARERVGSHDGREAFLGADILLARNEHFDKLTHAAGETFEIPPAVSALGRRAVLHYGSSILEMGRVSVDVMAGHSDNGSRIVAPIDVSPRVGGSTPAEVMAIRALVAEEKKVNGAGVIQAAVRLEYDPTDRPRTGKNFVDTSELIINAEVTGELR